MFPYIITNPESTNNPEISGISEEEETQINPLSKDKEVEILKKHKSKMLH